MFFQLLQDENNISRPRLHPLPPHGRAFLHFTGCFRPLSQKQMTSAEACAILQSSKGAGPFEG
jgi:hypothetical protein